LPTLCSEGITRPEGRGEEDCAERRADIFPSEGTEKARGRGGDNGHRPKTLYRSGIRLLYVGGARPPSMVCGCPSKPPPIGRELGVTPVSTLFELAASPNILHSPMAINTRSTEYCGRLRIQRLFCAKKYAASWQNSECINDQCPW